MGQEFQRSGSIRHSLKAPSEQIAVRISGTIIMVMLSDGGLKKQIKSALPHSCCQIQGRDSLMQKVNEIDFDNEFQFL